MFGALIGYFHIQGLTSQSLNCVPALLPLKWVEYVLFFLLCSRSLSPVSVDAYCSYRGSWSGDKKRRNPVRIAVEWFHSGHIFRLEEGNVYQSVSHLKHITMNCIKGGARSRRAIEDTRRSFSSAAPLVLGTWWLFIAADRVERGIHSVPATQDTSSSITPCSLTDPAITFVQTVSESWILLVSLIHSSSQFTFIFALSVSKNKNVERTGNN